MPSKTVLYYIRLFFIALHPSEHSKIEQYLCIFNRQAVLISILFYMTMKAKGCCSHEKTQYLFNRFGIGINFCRFPFDCPVGPNISLSEVTTCEKIPFPFPDCRLDSRRVVRL